jgi:hypothetical protein
MCGYDGSVGYIKIGGALYEYNNMYILCTLDPRIKLAPIVQLFSE